MSDSETPWTAARQASLSITNPQSLLRLTSTESVIILPSHPLSSLSPPNFSLSQHQGLFIIYLFIFRVFSNESVLCVKWPKYWSFNFNIGPSNEYSGLVSFGDGLLGSPCSPRDSQESSPTHSSKASILQCSAFLIVHLSHPYMTTGKAISLTRLTFAGNVMSQLFNMLSRLVITFLPRSKHLLISQLQSPSAVILEPPQNKVSLYFHCFPIYLP